MHVVIWKIRFHICRMKCLPERIPGDDANAWRCSRCGFRDVDTAGSFPDRIHRPCPAVTEEERKASALPIGDAVASVLDRAGITKERWSEALKAVGFSGICKCPERQAKLNELGDKLAKWWKGS